MPAGMTCSGGNNGDTCVVRCRNSALAGPFGGCGAVTNAVAASTAAVAGGNTTTTATAKTAPANGAAAAQVGAATAGKKTGAGFLNGLFGRTEVPAHKKRYIRSRIVRRAGWM
jgi:hypothetical protein